MSRNERDRETSVVTLSSCGGVGATGDEIKLGVVRDRLSDKGVKFQYVRGYPNR